jgi:glycerophosphoryl diester phosphodiesterase
MKILAHRGNRLHVAENTLTAHLSAYVAGADVLELDVQLTKDGQLVVSHDPTLERLTGEPSPIIETTLADLRKLNVSKTFAPRGAQGFSYRPAGRRRDEVETLPRLLEGLPRSVEKLIEMKHDSSLETGRREEFVTSTVEAIRRHTELDHVVVYSKDPENLLLARRLEPRLRVAAFDWELDAQGQLDLAERVDADGLVVEIGGVLTPQRELTELARELERLHREGSLSVGAIVYLYRDVAVPTEEEYEALRQHAFVWSLATDSMLDVAPFARPGWTWLEESFDARKIDTDRIALGYAKANPYGHVYQEDGVHVAIKEYDRDQTPPADPIERRLQSLQEQLWYALKEWPFYSGGGLGTVPPLDGDFSAEVDYTTTRVGQASTLEMAAVNVDPGAHQPPWEKDGKTPRLPRSIRDKDSFYDPHGAPPFVGAEHDEDDGYRINWNLGVEYDNNQYGRPVGDCTALAARLRLDRRGPYFAAYYRNDATHDWVCVGAVRNDSINPVVHLRCAGKRWRQEREDDPTQYYPIVAVEFVFRNLTIRRF